MDFRPQNLEQFIGQPRVKELLSIEIEAFKRRQKDCLVGKCRPMDVPMRHLLLTGQPGSGKSTLAVVVANEMGVTAQFTGAAALSNQEAVIQLMKTLPWDWYSKDMKSLTGKVPKPAVIFLDEAHLLKSKVQDMLLTAMEEWYIAWKTKDFLGREKPQAFNVPEFTIIAATNNPMDLNLAFRSRCVHLHLDPYTVEDLTFIVTQYLGAKHTDFEESVPGEIARRSRSGSRTAVQFTDRIMNVAPGKVTMEAAEKYFNLVEVDEQGLMPVDRLFLTSLHRMEGLPLGIETLASLCREPRESIEGIVEPYLIQLGFVVKTSRGRALTDNGKLYAEEHLCRKP